MMDISVVIPSYNQKKRTMLVLHGLKNQSFPKDQFEVIVVDNGSIDDTERELRAFHTVDLNLDIIRLDKNVGRSGGRNIGIRKAKGELVIFLDGDILPAPDLISSYWLTYRQNPKSYFCGYFHCLPDLEYFDDPKSGKLADIPTASIVRYYLAVNKDKMVIDEHQILSEMESIHAHSKKGIYPFEAIEKIQDQCFSYLEGSAELAVGWISFIPGNGAVVREGLLEVNGFDEDIPFLEGMELGYRLQRAGFLPCGVRGARGYHLYHYHHFSDPVKTVEETLVRRKAVEYMAAKWGDPAIRLLYFWWSYFWPDILLPSEAVIGNLFEVEKRYKKVRSDRIIGDEYQIVLDNHPTFRLGY